jgi:cbb3-type cytochrome oxidase subunit 1
MNTEDARNPTNDDAGVGRALYFAGWAVFVLSILLALSGKTSEPHSAVPFWFSFCILVAVSLVYLVGCLVSVRWRSKTSRRHFSPYLLGASGWLVLFLLFWILDRVAGY